MSGYFSSPFSLGVMITLGCQFYVSCLSFHLLVKCGHFSKCFGICPNRLNRILTAEVEEVNKVRNANDLSDCPHNDVEFYQNKNAQDHSYQQDNVQDQQTLVRLAWYIGHCLYVSAAFGLQAAVVNSSSYIVGYNRLNVRAEGS